jgi:arylsulfatase A-like enzyme
VKLVRSSGRTRRLLAAGLLLCLAFAPGCARREIRNVVLVSLDAVGAKHVGAYGYPRDTTPQLDAVAAQGTLFESASSQQVWTLTSHLTMLDGLYPKTHAASSHQAASPDAPALAELLAARGFSTAAFTTGVVYVSGRFGLARGFQSYSVGWRAADANRRIAPWLLEQARLEREDPEHRFFLFVHYFDAHSDDHGDVPYWSPEPDRGRYLPDGFRWDRKGDSGLLLQLRDAGATPEDRRVLTALYDASLHYLDEHGVGFLVDALRRSDLEEQTLLIVTADHGEEIFEHGSVIHAQPYQETVHVPLVLRGPGIPRGLRVGSLVELVDLAPTVLSLLGIPIPDAMQGDDLSPLLRGETPSESIAYTDGLFGGTPPYLGRNASAVTADLDGERWSLVARVAEREEDGGFAYGIRGAPELYRLDEDPGQRHDLAAQEPQRVTELSKRLLDWFARNEAAARALGRGEGAKPLLDEREREQLRALGYGE